MRSLFLLVDNEVEEQIRNIYLKRTSLMRNSIAIFHMQIDTNDISNFYQHRSRNDENIRIVHIEIKIFQKYNREKEITSRR